MSEVLDQSVLDELAAIMEGEFTSLLEAYLQDSQQRLHDCEQAWLAVDLDALRRSAHSLKGSSSNVGAGGLARHCERLEHLARDARSGQIPAALGDVATELEAVHQAVAELCRP